MVLGVAMAANLYDPAFATLGRIFGAARAAADHRADARRRLCLDRELAGHAFSASRRIGWRGTYLVYAALLAFVSRAAARVCAAAQPRRARRRARAG